MLLGAQSSDTPSIQTPVPDIVRPQQESFGNSNKGNQKNRSIGIVKHLPKLQFLKEETADSCLQRIIVSCWNQ